MHTSRQCRVRVRGGTLEIFRRFPIVLPRRNVRSVFRNVHRTAGYPCEIPEKKKRLSLVRLSIRYRGYHDARPGTVLPCTPRYFLLVNPGTVYYIYTYTHVLLL